jgi:hypothetical protein
VCNTLCGRRLRSPRHLPVFPNAVAYVAARRCASIVDVVSSERLQTVVSFPLGRHNLGIVDRTVPQHGCHFGLLESGLLIPGFQIRGRPGGAIVPSSM